MPAGEENTVNTSDDDSVWLSARRELLDAEKALQRARDRLAVKRRALPHRPIDTEYVFRGEFGKRSLHRDR